MKTLIDIVGFWFGGSLALGTTWCITTLTVPVIRSSKRLIGI